MSRRLVAVSAGLSQPSSSRLLSDRLVQSAVNAFAERGEQVEVSVIELREYARDLAHHLVSGFPGPRLAAAIDQVAAADALIMVSPVFSGSYSGLFKLFVDVLDRDALAGRPVLIGATGGSARHSLALEHAFRPLMSYLRTVTAPTAVFAAPEDWAPKDRASEGLLAERIARAGSELAALTASGLARVSAGNAQQRTDGLSTAGPATDGAEVVPFERLLGRGARG